MRYLGFRKSTYRRFIWLKLYYEKGLLDEKQSNYYLTLLKIYIKRQVKHECDKTRKGYRNLQNHLS